MVAARAQENSGVHLEVEGVDELESWRTTAGRFNMKRKGTHTVPTRLQGQTMGAHGDAFTLLGLALRPMPIPQTAESEAPNIEERRSSVLV